MFSQELQILFHLLNELVKWKWLNYLKVFGNIGYEEPLNLSNHYANFIKKLK